MKSYDEFDKYCHEPDYGSNEPAFLSIELNSYLFVIIYNFNNENLIQIQIIMNILLDIIIQMVLHYF